MRDHIRKMHEVPIIKSIYKSLKQIPEDSTFKLNGADIKICDFCKGSKKVLIHTGFLKNHFEKCTVCKGTGVSPEEKEYMNNEEKIQMELEDMFIERANCAKQGHKGLVLSSRIYSLPHQPLSITQNCATCNKVFKGIIIDSDSIWQLKELLK